MTNTVDYPDDDDKSNAALIVAAPELLEALRGCVEFMGSIGITDDRPDTDAARRLRVALAAIRKAEGK
jgi:hypothetical protein